MRRYNLRSYHWTSWRIQNIYSIDFSIFQYFFYNHIFFYYSILCVKFVNIFVKFLWSCIIFLLFDYLIYRKTIFVCYFLSNMISHGYINIFKIMDAITPVCRKQQLAGHALCKYWITYISFKNDRYATGCHNVFQITTGRVQGNRLKKKKNNKWHSCAI